MPRIIIYILLFTAIIQTTFGQSPYNFKTFGFDENGIRIGQVKVLDDSTIAFSGDYINYVPAYERGIIGLLDSDLDTICYYKIDSSKSQTYLFGNVLQIERDSFVICGYSYEKDQFIITSFNRNCQHNVIKRHDNNITTSGNVLSFIKSPYEDAYYITINGYHENDYGTATLIKLDNEFNIKWARNYEKQDRFVQCQGDLLFINENKILLPCFAITAVNVDEQHRQAMFIEIESIFGGEVNRVFTPDSMHVRNYCTVRSLSNFNQYYTTIGIDSSFYPIPTSPDNEWLDYKNGLSKVNEELDIIWRKEVGAGTWISDRNNYYEMIHANDSSGLIIVGDQGGFYDLPDSTYKYKGYIVKSDYEGNEIWRRYINYNPYPYATQSSLYDIVSSFNNGYIVTGQLQLKVDANELPERQPSIFFYIDENGCLVPGCEATDAISLESDELPIKVYPNPATDETVVYVPEGFDISPNNPATVRIIGLTGEVYKSVDIHYSKNNIVFNLQNLPSGHYVVGVIQAGKLITSEKLTVIK